MVYINDKKFACESCIKGHRSSSCHHNDRPLFEIKKKGRPVSQCERCRELRKSRRVHSKCMCDQRDVEEVARFDGSSSSGTKSRRFVHIAPALPNGLKGAISIPPSFAPADPRQKVESLLNPCNCKSIWNRCRCNTHSPTESSPSSNGLVALAKVNVIAAEPFSVFGRSDTVSPVSDKDATERDGGIFLWSPSSHSCAKKRPKDRSIETHRGPELPPLLLVPGEKDDVTSVHVPRFSTAISIPPMKSVISLAGTGCSCGFTCACPGCIEHRVPSNLSTNQHPGDTSSSQELKDCADGCGSCVDFQRVTELYPDSQSSTTGFAGPSQSMMEEFLARAASLPAPPRNRVANLDPTNTAVFPPDMFPKEKEVSLMTEHTEMMDMERVRLAWGLVSVPKLDCCEGQCGCPDDECGCGTSCQGCCALEDCDRETAAVQNVNPLGDIEDDMTSYLTLTEDVSLCCRQN